MVPSVGFATLAETLHEGEGTKSFAGRRWRSRRRRCVVISCFLVTDGIYSDTLRNVVGKNLELTFSKEPAPPALCIQERLGPAVNAASVLSRISASDTPGASSVRVVLPLAIVKTARSVITI